MVGGQHLIIKSAVIGGVGVVLSSSILDVLEELATANILGTFKKQVLEEMGHPRSVWVFVFGSHMVHHGDHGYWSGVVLVKDDVKSIVEVVLLELDGRPLCCSCANDCRQAEGYYESHVPVFGLGWAR